MKAPPPPIPPPPIPELDWTTPSAYLSSCHEWLDQMTHWQGTVLPAWIERTRKYLLQQALAHPDAMMPLPDARASTGALPAQPLLAVTEMRLPSLD